MQGVASTPDEVLVANGRGSCTGDFLAIDGVEIKAVSFKSKVSALFSTESAMTAKAAKAAAAGLMVEVGMAERALVLGRNFGGEAEIMGDILTSSSFVLPSPVL